MRPHAKKTEVHRKNVDFAVARGKFLPKDKAAELFRAIEDALESSYSKYKVRWYIYLSLIIFSHFHAKIGLSINDIFYSHSLYYFRPRGVRLIGIFYKLVY